MDSLSDAQIFTTLDATTGYYQIAIEEKSKDKTASSWKGGHYEFNRLPFGLCNAHATFQRAMDKIFENERGKFIIPYFDDIIIYSKNEKEHEKHLDIALGRIKAAGLSLNPGKCKFRQREIKILGSIITNGIVRPDPEKVKAI